MLQGQALLYIEDKKSRSSRLIARTCLSPSDWSEACRQPARALARLREHTDAVEGSEEAGERKCLRSLTVRSTTVLLALREPPSPRLQRSACRAHAPTQASPRTRRVFVRVPMCPRACALSSSGPHVWVSATAVMCVLRRDETSSREGEGGLARSNSNIRMRMDTSAPCACAQPRSQHSRRLEQRSGGGCSERADRGRAHANEHAPGAAAGSIRVITAIIAFGARGRVR